MFTRAISWSVKGRVSRGHDWQAPGHMLAPLPHPHPLLHSLIQEGQSQEILLRRTSFRGGRLPAQVSVQLTGVISHGGMWAPSLHLIGCSTLLPAFPLPQASAPPRLHSCSASSPCPLFPCRRLQPSLRPIRTHSPIQTAPPGAEGGEDQLHVKFKQLLFLVDCPRPPTFSSLLVWPTDDRSKPEAARMGYRWF